MNEAAIWSTASELRAQIGRGEQSVVALVEACLAQIDLLDATLRAFFYVDRAGAVAAAHRADDAAALRVKSMPAATIKDALSASS